ncbi:MAG: hypothetical protein ABR598_09440 [Candidatus Dormibacteria bacterium]
MPQKANKPEASGQGSPASGPAPDAPAPEPAPATPPAEPVPLEVPLEEQIGALPPLQYPGGDRDQDFETWAAEKRRGRLRTEIIGGVLILIAGVVATLATGRTLFFILAIFGFGGLAAYEFLVSSFE